MDQKPRFFVASIDSGLHMRSKEKRNTQATAPPRWSSVSLLLTLLPIAGLTLVIVLVGWKQSTLAEQTIILCTRVIAALYGTLFLIDWYRDHPKKGSGFIQRFVFPGLAILILLSALLENVLAAWAHEAFEGLSIRAVVHSVAMIQQVTAVFMRVAATVPEFESPFLRRLNPGSVLFGTFGMLILIGTLLLKMPNATSGAISWIDALFTSTSAVCVTGLIVVDTATAFTPLGQLIILFLIQSGAFGIVSMTFFLAVTTGRGFSVAGRVLLKDVLNVENLRTLRTSIVLIVFFTISLEMLGWIGLYQIWKQAATPIDNLLWVSLFHSVSAFCNAGFSTFSNGLADPAALANHPVQAIIMVLIVLGGIGFPVLIEVFNRIRHFRRRSPKKTSGFTIHFKLAVMTTVALLTAGTLLLFLSDTGSSATTVPERIWIALFNAITSRTAGFNISDIPALSSAATAIVILLMFIGGGPGGFAGGIKTTTFALSLLNLRRIVFARDDVEVFRRRIDEVLCHRAFAVLLLSLIWIFTATTTILLLQPELRFLDTLFETVSAFATVGLSKGVTGELSSESKVIIVITMFVGRIGVMNFFFSLLVVPPKEQRLRMPRERIIIE